MKKVKGTWLPLALILVAGSALLAADCDNGNDPAKKDPVPEKTQITFDGKNVWFDPNYSADSMPAGLLSSDDKGRRHPSGAGCKGQLRKGRLITRIPRKNSSRRGLFFISRQRCRFCPPIV
jgi:hypothetical protein